MKIRLLAAAAVSTILLSACATRTMEGSAKSAPTLPEASATTASPTTTTPAGPSRNARGNIEKALGEEGGIVDLATDAPIVTFTIDSIAPAQCTPDWQEYYQPENGHIIAAQMRVSTSPALGTTDGGNYFTVSGYDFSFIGPDNITHTDLETLATYSCLPEGQQFTSDPLQPAQQYVGAVVLDLPAPNGTLIYRPSGMTDGGWEWNF